MIEEHANDYRSHNPWEKSVQYCMRDFLRPGDVSYDVGGNIGALAIYMAGLVGDVGRVFTFEPNPEVIRQLRRDLTFNQVGNVEVVEKAVWSEAGLSLPFFRDTGSPYASASSLVRRPNAFEEIRAETVTLDQFTAQGHPSPQLIKLDVEDAEFAVLRGGIGLLITKHPIVILEYWAPSYPEEADPLTLLCALGYACFDCNTYRPMTRERYLAKAGGAPLANVIALPAKMAHRYAEVTFDPVKEWPLDGNMKTAGLPLEAGRYVLSLELGGAGREVVRLQILDGEGRRLDMVQGAVSLLRGGDAGTACFVVHLDSATRISACIEPVDAYGGDVAILSASAGRVIIAAQEYRSDGTD